MSSTWRPLLLFVVLVCLIVVLFYYTTRSFSTSTVLRVTYLDVGQGDATFIESPSGAQVLIDGGRDASVLSGLTEAMGYFDRTIDVVIATHPDADHIGGLIGVLKRYKVRTILLTTNRSDTPEANAFLRAVEEEGAALVHGMRGDVFDLGGGPAGSTTLAILFPDRDVTDLESNTSSIVAKVTYGTADFLFMGDAPSSIETYLVSLGSTGLESEVLKVGHHGSRTSTNPLFIGAVKPMVGIISAGKDNTYGHPHSEVLDTLRRHNVLTKNTADDGSILVESDGASVWVR